MRDRKCCDRWAVAWSLKVMMLMTANSARKSPKTETTCAYQRRRSMGIRITSPIESGAGSSGSMGGLGIDSAGAGLGEVVLMSGECMVLHYLEETHLRQARPKKISRPALSSYLIPQRGEAVTKRSPVASQQILIQASLEWIGDASLQAQMRTPS